MSLLMMRAVLMLYFNISDQYLSQHLRMLLPVIVMIGMVLPIQRRLIHIDTLMTRLVLMLLLKDETNFVNITGVCYKPVTAKMTVLLTLSGTYTYESTNDEGWLIRHIDIRY